jgi:hypothetical protein
MAVSVFLCEMGGMWNVSGWSGSVWAIVHIVYENTHQMENFRGSSERYCGDFCR